jgi:hypothetical protein
MVKKYATQMTRRGPVLGAFAEPSWEWAPPVMRRPPPHVPVPALLADPEDEDEEEDAESEITMIDESEDESVEPVVDNERLVAVEAGLERLMKDMDGIRSDNLRITRDNGTVWTLERAFESRMSTTMSSYGAQVAGMRGDLNRELRDAMRSVVLDHLADPIARGAAHEHAIEALAKTCQALTEKAYASDKRAMQAEAQLSAAKGRLTSLEERCLKLEKAQREIDKSEARRDRAVAQDKQWRVSNEPKIAQGARAFKSLDALTSRLGALLTIDAAAEKARSGDRDGASETVENWETDPTQFLHKLSQQNAGGGESVALRHGLRLKADVIAGADDEPCADAVLALFRRVSTLERDKAERNKVVQLSDRLGNLSKDQEKQVGRLDRKIDGTQAALNHEVKTLNKNIEDNAKVTFQNEDHLDKHDGELAELKESVGSTFQAVRTALAPELHLLEELDEFRAFVEDDHAGRLEALETTRSTHDQLDLKADKEAMKVKASHDELQAVVDSVRTLAITVNNFGEEIRKSESIARNAGNIARKADALVKEVRKRATAEARPPLEPVGVPAEEAPPKRRMRRKKKRDDEGMLVGGYDYEEPEETSPTKRVEVELPKLPAPGLALHKHRLEWSKPSSTRELIAEEGVRAAGVLRRKRRPGKSSLAASMPRAEEGSSWIKG